jgi:hypothetical protein
MFEGWISSYFLLARNLLRVQGIRFTLNYMQGTKQGPTSTRKIQA